MKESRKFIYAALALFLTLTTTLVTLAIPAFAAGNKIYDHTYVGIEKNGYNYKDTEPALFRLKDNDQNISLTYCADKDTDTVKNSKYTRTNISDANYYTKENGDKIRAQLFEISILLSRYLNSELVQDCLTSMKKKQLPHPSSPCGIMQMEKTFMVSTG